MGKEYGRKEKEDKDTTRWERRTEIILPVTSDTIK
jgi:hypothetical protein